MRATPGFDGESSSCGSDTHRRRQVDCGLRQIHKRAGAARREGQRVWCHLGEERSRTAASWVETIERDTEGERLRERELDGGACWRWEKREMR